ncbi:hypothetical protein NL676_034603 [Syzygium grande]|nr:hypothetical protein NL676_034603 [Syzygium grande]
MAPPKVLLVVGSPNDVHRCRLWGCCSIYPGPPVPGCLPLPGSRLMVLCLHPSSSPMASSLTIAATSSASRPQDAGGGSLSRVAEEVGVPEATLGRGGGDAPPEALLDELQDFEEKRWWWWWWWWGMAGVSGGGDGYNGDCEGERKVAFGRSASAWWRRVDLSEKVLVLRKATDGDHHRK